MQIIFIHGSGATGKAWKYQSDHFPGSIAIDLPGHPEGDFLATIPGMVTWLKAYVDQHRLSQLVLVGHSLGGGVALQYALDYPDDMLALILVGSGGRLRVHPDTIAFMAQTDASSAAFVGMIDAMLGKVSDDLSAVLSVDSRALGPAVFLNDFRACDEFDVMDRLGEINTPTLAIVGTEDIMTPLKYSKYMVEQMPNAKMVTIEGGTHYAFAEYPGAVNAAMDEFLAPLEQG